MLFKAINRWEIIKMRDKYVPGSNCVREETVHEVVCLSNKRESYYSWFLWICKTRLHKRRSDRVSHPSSSLSFAQLEPCHAPVTARAAWYCTLSNIPIRGSKVESWGGGLIFGGMWYKLYHNNQDENVQEPSKGV